MIDIGKQITAMRRERDITQEQLATLIGVSAQTVSKWECGISHRKRYHHKTHAYITTIMSYT